ncbi:hypothetical protein GGR95_001927 [Sulfitobacter undariae]|uniref:Dihydroxy-acid dehydratase n=1 Tax=Sulfitobacter undariae TaxID=1563671 RepID=A0A7W6E3W3_9RHOB|nr:hypothetical protein [Sulfitobacter undariae]MBB3994282.1 hypothetical protein [Sulfitobacter undariae]
MTIWSCKKLAALSITMMLGACQTGGTGNTLLAGLAPPSDAALPTVPLRQAKMMRGKVTLVPPSGYCIDPESLTQSFAMMARCDALGAATGGSGAPIGILTVSLARKGKTAALPTAQEIAATTGLGAPQNAKRQATSVIFKTTGTPPSSTLAKQHWRAVAMVGGFTMGSALYGPEGRRAVSAEGAEILEEMIQGTTKKTIAG